MSERSEFFFRFHISHKRPLSSGRFAFSSLVTFLLWHQRRNEQIAEMLHPSIEGEMYDLPVLAIHLQVQAPAVTRQGDVSDGMMSHGSRVMGHESWVMIDGWWLVIDDRWYKQNEANAKHSARGVKKLERFWKYMSLDKRSGRGTNKRELSEGETRVFELFSKSFQF